MRDKNDKYNRRFRRGVNKKRMSIKLFIFLFILLIGFLSIGYYILNKVLPNFKTMSLYEFYTDLKQDELYIVLKDERLALSNNPIQKGDEIYIPVDFVKEYIDPYIFWDKPANKLTITTEDKVIRMKTEELTYYVNDKKMELNLPVYNIDGVAYMPASMITTLYPVSIDFADEYNFVKIDYTDQEGIKGEVIDKKTNLRFEPDKKSYILEKLILGQDFMMYGEELDYTKVRMPNGLIGYIFTEDIQQTETIPPIKREEVVSKPSKKEIQGKINLVWDQVTKAEANLNDARRENHKGVNVLSYTWFSFDEEKLNGDIVNIADQSLVDWAHENDYQVWALITDNFNNEVSHAVLTDADIREHVIKQLLAFASMYDLDGINIDYENVSKADAEYYLQFLRELRPLLKAQDVLLSVDMYVPTYTKYYNRTEVAKTVDYICVMTYDEHYGGSPESGPVASLSFVDDGILKTLEEVPKEKVLMGLPFYNRIWRVEETDGVSTHTIKNLGMASAYEQFIDNGAEFIWLADIGSYYGEYKKTEEGKEVTYKLWLEDERSIEEKMKIFEKYDLKGVACWKRGLEKDEIWDVIYPYIKN